MIDLEKLRQETKERIQKLGVTDSAFARLIGVQQGSLSRFLSQKTGLSFEGAMSLLDELGYNLSRTENSPNLPTTIQNPNELLPAAIEKIVSLERMLAEKDKQLAEFIEYKHRWDAIEALRRDVSQARICERGRDHDPPAADGSGEG